MQIIMRLAVIVDIIKRENHTSDIAHGERSEGAKKGGKT